MQRSYDAIIVGAGAAGLYCALHAGRRGRRVLVIEHNSEVGAKILISGGGRCNFTNVQCAPERFLSANSHFARSALARHGPEDFIALVRAHGIAFYEKTLGQLFCEGRGAARRIVQMLLDECAVGNVEVRTSCAVRTVSKGVSYRVETDQGAFEAAALVIASGGLSIPKLGASDFGFRVATQFDIPMVAPRPGLVPLTFAADDVRWMQPLSGVSGDVVARCAGASFTEAALFTHRGLSGPAILQASSYWRTGTAVELDWAPGLPDDFLVQRKRARAKALVKTVLGETLAARLAEALCQSGPGGPIGACKLGECKDDALIAFMQSLKRFELQPVGTEGYAKAEVTVGGVGTEALSQQSMVCREVPGLYFIGECVDVTGWLGGYNFQWAWSSGWAAGTAL